MRAYLLIALAGALILGACDFDVPVATQPEIAIDPALVGYWELVPVEDDGIPGAAEEVLILRHSRNEYLVRHTQDEREMLFRAFPVNIGGVAAVQLQWLSMGDEPVAESEGARFTLVSYELSGDQLVVKGINTDLVSSGLKDGKAIRAAVRANRDAEDLFTEPMTFKRFRL